MIRSGWVGCRMTAEAAKNPLLALAGPISSPTSLRNRLIDELFTLLIVPRPRFFNPFFVAATKMSFPCPRACGDRPRFPRENGPPSFPFLPFRGLRRFGPTVPILHHERS